MVMITLSNGLRVGNFSSPHDFTFTDGNVLPKCSDEESIRLKVDFHESPVGSDNYTYTLNFTMSYDVVMEMKKWYRMWENKEIDFVLCPLPMIKAIREELQSNPTHQLPMNHIAYSPFRCIRMDDRINKLSSINKFTI